MVTKDTVRRGYDDLGATYADTRSLTGRDFELLEAFLADLPSEPFVLDAGCGPGRPVLSRLTEIGIGVGLDFSRQQLELARDHVQDAHIINGDMTALPLRSSSIDAVVCLWSLIHVPLDDHQAVLEEFARVLGTDGRVLLCEGTNAWVGENPDWLECGVEMQWEIAGREVTSDQLRTAGFEVIDQWGVPEDLEDEESDVDDADLPWTFFHAQVAQ